MIVQFHLDTTPRTSLKGTEKKSSLLQQAIQSAFAFFQSTANRDALVHPMTEEAAAVTSARSTAVHHTMDIHRSSQRLTDMNDINDEETASSNNINIQSGSDYSIVRIRMSLCRTPLDFD